MGSLKVSTLNPCGKACLAMVKLPSDIPNSLGVTPGGFILLLAPDESICLLFGHSKIGKHKSSSMLKE